MSWVHTPPTPNEIATARDQVHALRVGRRPELHSQHLPTLPVERLPVEPEPSAAAEPSPKALVTPSLREGGELLRTPTGHALLRRKASLLV